MSTNSPEPPQPTPAIAPRRRTRSGTRSWDGLHNRHGEAIDPRVVRPPLMLPRRRDAGERRHVDAESGGEGRRTERREAIGGQVLEAFDPVRVHAEQRDATPAL